MIDAATIKAAFAGFTGEKMLRAWRNRSPVTCSYWTFRARTLLGAAASLTDVWKLAAALYAACSEFTWTDGSFRADTLAMAAWVRIAEHTAAYILNPPERALSRGEYELRRKARREQAVSNIYAHYFCFRCRKAWAPAAVRNRKHCPRVTPESRPCPDCGHALIGLGLAFEPPKQSNRRTWRQLEAKARAGNRFLKP